MSTPWYVTRDEVKAELDVRETARSNARVDRACAAATEGVNGLCHRVFYPVQGTRRFDWPNRQGAVSWRLWLDSNDLISVTSLATGGDTIAADDFFLRRSDDVDAPPYSHIELDLASNAAFGGGDTHQEDISVTGLWGYGNDEADVANAASSPSSSAQFMGIDDSSGLGVGSLIRVDDERMIVTGKNMGDSGQTLTAALTAVNNDQTVAVASGAGLHQGEIILVDAEKMRVDEVAGNNLIVTRAWDGSSIAAHDSGTTVYLPRTLVVTRGVLGTTAAEHTSGAALLRWEPPALIRQLALAEALTDLLQGRSGYARTAGSGENEREATGRGLKDLRDRAYTTYGRKARARAV